MESYYFSPPFDMTISPFSELDSWFAFVCLFLVSVSCVNPPSSKTLFTAFHYLYLVKFHKYPLLLNTIYSLAILILFCWIAIVSFLFREIVPH